MVVEAVVSPCFALVGVLEVSGCFFVYLLHEKGGNCSHFTDEEIVKEKVSELSSQLAS